MPPGPRRDAERVQAGAESIPVLLLLLIARVDRHAVQLVSPPAGQPEVGVSVARLTLAPEINFLLSQGEKLGDAQLIVHPLIQVDLYIGSV